MELNLQTLGIGTGESEQTSCSEDTRIVTAIRKIMKKEVEVMVIDTIKSVVVPTVEDLVRKVVQEELHLAQEKLLTGGNRLRDYADETTMPTEKNLQLNFLDEVSVNVLTGKAINGKEGTPVRVALVDTTGNIVKSEPEASAKVEILVLEASFDDNEQNLSPEGFNNRIIKECDKKKPHFTKSKYIYLQEGIGVLSDVKLGHDSSWMKSCKCRLGARLMQSFAGTKVKEAWTKSFTVLDSRSKFYGKHYPPLLSDDLWRLENIGKDGAPCKRLNEENIFTVQDFLILHCVDPQRLHKIAGTNARMWKATVDHAHTCLDKKIYFYCPSSSESKDGVAFDAVGGLKGIIRDSRYVSVDNLSVAEKDCTNKLLLSAFGNRKDITSFDDEASLLRHLACQSNSNDGYVPADPGTSYQHTESSVGQSYHSNFLCHSDLYHQLENLMDTETMMAIFSENNDLPETLIAEPQSQQQSKAGSIHLVRAVIIMLWLFRARKRAITVGHVHVLKKQKIDG